MRNFLIITLVSSISAYTAEQHQQQYPPYHQQSEPSEGLSTFGTSTSLLPNQSNAQSVIEDKNDGTIDFEFISKILRMTCEMNRQLHFGTRDKTCRTRYIGDANDGHQEAPLNTIFHGKKPRPQHQTFRRGVERWGPKLELYLQEIQSTLQCASPTCLALALIYIDRACSADTLRSDSACPFLTPRTVHRMLLTAMVTASKAIGRNVSYNRIQEKFGVSEKALHDMERWMIGAMGEEGVWVSDHDIESLLQKWRLTYHNTKGESRVEQSLGNENLSYGGSPVEDNRMERDIPFVGQRSTSSKTILGASDGQWSFSYTEETITTVNPQAYNHQSQWGQYHPGYRAQPLQTSDGEESDTNGESVWI
mmetsp:Transcript_30554/g.37303  ORF Transcript_30554/g.37303 Transcript_30554/m.37303 type:complete len:364 (-) Transcript_30554:81-1172(-)|eukprot:CAMPEP_0172510310 /NCGR_PEP_ID=MMETSP1066-20121228/227765_1 /TAXON_ID=671091 /ORGANISM="Coscinodiscus wailesii, Strain CCMP2513" /LENGTH=363 /DNA_ID=CAMNT_0013289219 /DNA_START=114 /DNA_END=1205 /DNA_ORIENTATION=+